MTSRLDPRYFQMSVLGLLLSYGVFYLRFDMTWQRAALIVGTTLATQYLCSLGWKIPFDYRSALISGFSLSLFLRTNHWELAVFAAAIAILSKFTIRVKGKHLFNPTNFAIVFMMIFFSRQIWVSPGQWGNEAIAACFMLGMGSLVVHKSRRSDITLAFLFFWAAVLFGRSLWMGEPMTIPWHRMQSGVVLLFAYHMISDPKSTPDSRAGRILFSALVAAGAGVVHFALFRNNGLLWSLAACHLLVPFIDKILPDRRFQWDGGGDPPGRPYATSTRNGGSYAPVPS
ncbi:MAG TPA: RnfABCDGE type electron transport complex subunit D [bacterium]|nr:RnfABCDGE type electron transport complex subunit D [bacterium]